MRIETVSETSKRSHGLPLTCKASTLRLDGFRFRFAQSPCSAVRKRPMAPQGGMAAIVARRYRRKLACLGFVARCGRVCQRQTPGEAFNPATYLLRCLVWFPVYAFGKTGKALKTACSKLLTTACETVHTFETAGTAGNIGISVSGSNKTSGTKTA